jgi:hypothetical protein
LTLTASTHQLDVTPAATLITRDKVNSDTALASTINAYNGFLDNAYALTPAENDELMRYLHLCAYSYAVALVERRRT